MIIYNDVDDISLAKKLQDEANDQRAQTQPKKNKVILQLYKIFAKMGFLRDQFSQEDTRIETDSKSIAKIIDPQDLVECYDDLLQKYLKTQHYISGQEKWQEQCLSIVESKCDEEVEVAFKKKKFKILYSELLEVDGRKNKFRNEEMDSHDRIQNDVKYVNDETARPKVKVLKSGYKYLLSRYEALQVYTKEQEKSQKECTELFGDQYRGCNGNVGNDQSQKSCDNSKGVPLTAKKETPKRRRQRKRPVVRTSLPAENYQVLKSGPVRHSHLPPLKLGPVRHSPLPPLKSGPVRHSPVPPPKSGSVRHSTLPPPKSGPVHHSPVPPHMSGPVRHSPAPPPKSGPVRHSPPLMRHLVETDLPSPSDFVKYIIRPAIRRAKTEQSRQKVLVVKKTSNACENATKTNRLISSSLRQNSPENKIRLLDSRKQESLFLCVHKQTNTSILPSIVRSTTTANKNADVFTSISKIPVLPMIPAPPKTPRLKSAIQRRKYM